MAKFTKKLHAPKGTDEANHDGVSYRVDNDGTIEVPVEAAGPLLALGGFTADDDSDPVPDGKVRVSHGYATGCSWGGEAFEPQKDGTFLVPVAAVADLASHGFTIVEASQAPAPKSPAIPQLKLK